MTNEITSTHEMAEQVWDGHSEPGDVPSDIVATKEAEGRGIEFHVSMRDYTQRDMEALIVEAAASQIMGKFGDRTISKQIEEAALRQISSRVDEALKPVTAEIINQPMIAEAFSKKEPITLKEFIGLCGREYLSQYVDDQGKPTQYSSYSRCERRVDKIVRGLIDAAFKKEIEAQTSAIINEVRAKMRDDMKAMLEAEKKRLREALSYEVKS